MSQGGQSQSSEGAGVFELPIDTGAVNEFPLLNGNLFASAYDSPATKLPVTQGSTLQDAGFDGLDKVQKASQDLVPYFGAQSVAQTKPESLPKSGTIDMACVTTLYNNDAGHEAMRALQADRSFEDMVNKAA